MRHKHTPPPSMVFEGMETHIAAQDAAAGEYTAEQLSIAIRQTLGDVSKNAGEMERNAPLFCGTGENPLLFGWDHADAQPLTLLEPHHD